MTRMSTIYSRLSYGSGTTLAGCGVSAKAYAETAKTAKEVSWMLADRIAGLSLSDWAIIVGIACTVITCAVMGGAIREGRMVQPCTTLIWLVGAATSVILSFDIRENL